MSQLTFSIIKPDAVKRNISGEINAMIEKSGFKIVAQKMIHMTKKQAEEFYSVHKTRSFFDELIEFMISGSVIVQVLKKENAVLDYRNIMGATNPLEAEDGTIRKAFAKSIGENCVHGSDSIENAKTEITYFFSGLEFVNL